MKDKIIGWLKVALLVYMMVSGFQYNFMFIWIGIGLPTVSWAWWLLAVLSGVAAWAYVKWVSVELED